MTKKPTHARTNSESSSQRCEGFGEIDVEALRRATLGPPKHRLVKVKMRDDVAADNIFTSLMGDLVKPRREFIEQNALNVRHLDS